MLLPVLRVLLSPRPRPLAHKPRRMPTYNARTVSVYVGVCGARRPVARPESSLPPSRGGGAGRDGVTGVVVAKLLAPTGAGFGAAAFPAHACWGWLLSFVKPVFEEGGREGGLSAAAAPDSSRGFSLQRPLARNV